MMDGILNIYKERGFTSHDVVAKLRGILGMKKIGHTGTLDPDACGVLPVCLGRATKVCGLLTDKRKTYETTLLLGVETDTQDISGECLARRPVKASREQICQAIASFEGDQWQVPPMYSAIKVGGKRLYELAREGKTVERKPRPVCFYEIGICSIEGPRIRLRVTCSKGTYIRTLCHDIGQALGCGGCMETLLRTQVGPYRLEDSITLEQIQALVKAGQADQALHPVDSLFMDCLACRIRPGYEKYMYNGNALKPGWLQAGEAEAARSVGDVKAGREANGRDVNAAGEKQCFRIRLYTLEGQFFGLYAYRADEGCYRLETMFYGG